MTGEAHITGQEAVVRDDLGRPVSCQIFAEADEDGVPEILRSVEIVGAEGTIVLSQSPIDEEEVLLIYKNWRSRPENQDLIRRVEAPQPPKRKRK